VKLDLLSQYAVRNDYHLKRERSLKQFKGEKVLESLKTIYATPLREQITKKANPIVMTKSTSNK